MRGSRPTPPIVDELTRPEHKQSSEKAPHRLARGNPFSLSTTTVPYALANHVEALFGTSSRAAGIPPLDSIEKSRASRSLYRAKCKQFSAPLQYDQGPVQLDGYGVSVWNIQRTLLRISPCSVHNAALAHLGAPLVCVSAVSIDCLKHWCSPRWGRARSAL